MHQDIIKAIVQAGGEPYEVGGCVRDRILGLKPKDIDIEVYNIEPLALVELLRKFGKAEYVGKFAIVKLRRGKEEFDFSLPRIDNKVGDKHTDFEVKVDHTLTPQVAASRRDFTINSMSRHCVSGEIVDPFFGQWDLNKGVLRATSNQFGEDPLRVLRGFQFASRFNLTADKATATKCSELAQQYKTISKERIWMEWYKWATQGNKPSAGLKFLVDTKWIFEYPELNALMSCPHDPIWHPEGDVFVHTCHVCDEAATIAIRESLDEDSRITLMLSALCHDLGKPSTTKKEDGRWRSHGHCEEGVPIAESFLKSIMCPQKYIDKVKTLTANHLAHANKPRTNRSVRRLAVRLDPANIQDLIYLIEADTSGRPPLPKGLPASAKLIQDLARDKSVIDEMPKPIMGGKHLISRGLTPGKEFGDILKECYQIQIDDLFEDEAVGGLYLNQLLELRKSKTAFKAYYDDGKLAIVEPIKEGFAYRLLDGTTGAIMAEHFGSRFDKS